MEILSQNLKTLRERRNYTLSDVAGLIYVHTATYCNWEKGRHEPPLDALRRLKQLYGVSLDTLTDTNIQETS